MISTIAAGRGAHAQRVSRLEERQKFIEERHAYREKRRRRIKQMATSLKDMAVEKWGTSVLPAKPPPTPPPQKPPGRECIPSKGTPKERIFLTLEKPNSSLVAKALAYFMLFLIVLSITTFVVETMLVFLGADGELADPLWWERVEAACTYMFTVEYVTKIVCCPPGELASFVRKPLNVVDLLAILPYYLELIFNKGGGTQVLRALRLVRIFRIGRASNFNTLVGVFYRTIKRSIEPLVMMSMLVVIVAVVFASLVWFAERGEWDDEAGIWVRPDGNESPYASIPVGMWWALVTFTTVGYGDMAPITPWGQFFGVMAMMAGLLVIALPSSVIGTNFESVFREVELENKMATIKAGGGDDDDDDDGEEKDVDPFADAVEEEKERERQEGALLASLGGGGPDGPPLDVVQAIFPRWEARVSELAVITEEMGGVLQALEEQMGRVEELCNKPLQQGAEQAADAAAARAAAMESPLKMPSSPHSRLYSLGYRATSTLLEASKKAQKEAEMKELV